MIEKDYLGAWDLADAAGKPRDFTLEIERVESKILKTKEDPKGKRKVAITFAGARKSFVANSTNCQLIEAMYGGETTAWKGKKITLYGTTTSVGPKRNVPCIRVRPMIPKAAAETLAETLAEKPVDAAMREAQDEAFAREAGEGP
jgi:hypothetical protein